MAQNALTVVNGSGLNVRTAFNLAIQAVNTDFAGATDPATMSPSNAFSYMLWLDTANNLVKQRNKDNDAWVNKGTLLADGTIQWYEPLSIPIPASSAQGDIIYRGASGFERLPAGTNGQLLKTQGASANPAWVDPPSGAVYASGAEAVTGTETAKAISPATLRSGLNASGSAPVFACRAWVNFNGTVLTGTYSQSGTTVTVTMTSHGMSVGQNINLTITSGTGVSGNYTVATVANANTFTYTAGTSLTTSGNITRNLYIKASGNVSSITDNGIGDYTINFTTALQDAGYAPVISITGASLGETRNTVSIAGDNSGLPLLKTSTQLRILVGWGHGAAPSDSSDVSVVIFR